MTHFYPMYYLILGIAGTAIFSRLASLLKYLFLLFLQKKKVSIIPEKTDTDNFIEAHTAKFLATFNDKTTDYNENVDFVMYDREKYQETIKDENNEIEKKWKTRILMESTPRGNLFMVYNIYRQCFEYYADSYIPYNILNACAMKYVTIYRCRDFYEDELTRPENHFSQLTISILQHEKNKKEEENKKKEPTKKMNNSEAFLKPKPKPKPTSVIDINKKDDANIEKNKKENKNRVTNKFSYMGKLVNYSLLNKPKKENPLNGFKTGMLDFGKNNSYAEYKKRAAAASSSTPNVPE